MNWKEYVMLKNSEHHWGEGQYRLMSARMDIGIGWYGGIKEGHLTQS